MSGEITNKNEWKAQELWMIGVDTPDGIKCCLGASKLFSYGDDMN